MSLIWAVVGPLSARLRKLELNKRASEAKKLLQKARVETR